MSTTRRHPTWAELNRLADGELSGERRQIVAEHATRCSRCRARLDFLTQVRRAASDIRHPAPPRDLLHDILRDRAEGRRAILPIVAVSERPARRTRALAAGLALALMTGLATILVVSEAGAGASELLFRPAAPKPGEALRVTYRPTSGLAGRSALRLRARVRRPGDSAARSTLGEHLAVRLAPDRDGTYTGSLIVPRDAVYAAFAVEDLAGRTVDDRGGRLWELRMHDPAGVPILSALRQQFLARQGRDWPRAGESLREMTALYPSRVEGWSRLLVHEAPALSPEEAAASLAMHKEMFRSLDSRAIVAQQLPVEELESLVRYSRALEDGERLGYWLRRLAEVDPAHPSVVLARTLERYEEDGAPAALDYLESVWSGGIRPSVAYEAGLDLALRSRDSLTASRWARRGIQLTTDLTWATRAIRTMVSHPITRPEGMERARDLAARLAHVTDERRPLHRSRDEAAREARRPARELLVGLGGALFEVDEHTAALIEFDRADSLGGWQPDLYRGRMGALMAVGDTTAALTDIGRILVDPVTPPAELDSLRSALGALVADSSARWATAWEEMVGRVSSELPPARRAPAASLVSESGERIALRRLIRGRPTVLLFWDRRAQMSEQVVHELHNAVRRVEGSNGQILWISPESQSPALEAFSRTWNLDVPRFQDPGSRLAVELGEWSARACYVIDEHGDIRGRIPSLVDAVRLLLILERNVRPTA